MCANAWGFSPARATLWPVKLVVAAGEMRLRAGVLWGTQITDPENERTIYIAAGGLLLLAIALAVGTVWWWRNSRVEHPALGPLEVMGTRSWWKGDWTARRRRLDEVRPAGAEPGDPDEQVDLSAVATAEALPFDDLADPADAAAAPASVSLEELVAALGMAPAADSAGEPVVAVAATDDATAATPAPRASVVIDTSAPSREVELPVEPVAVEQRAPIDPLLRQQRND